MSSTTPPSPATPPEGVQAPGGAADEPRGYGPDDGRAGGESTEAGATAATAPRASAEGTRAQRFRPHVLPILLLWLVSAVLVTLSVYSFTQVSPIDEAAHLDYIVDLPDEIPASGEQMNDLTLEIWACRGMALDVVLPDCQRDTGGTYNPNAFPGEAYGLAGSHPPAYYAVTWAVGSVIKLATSLDLLTAYRLVGILWLGAALTVSYLVAVRLGAPRWGAFGVGLILAATSETLTSAATLGPDTASWFAGGLVFLAGLAHRGRGRDTVLLLAACLLAALTKQTALLAVGAVMVHLALRRPLGLGVPGRSWAGDFVVAIAAGVTFVIPSMGWTLYSSSLSVLPADQIPQNQWFVLEDVLAPRDVVTQSWSFLSPLTDGWVAPFLEGGLDARSGAFVTGLLILGLVAAVLGWRLDRRVGVVAIGVLVLTLLGGPMLAVANYLLSNSYFPIHPRYGYPLLPGLLALVACTVSSVPLRRALIVLGSVMVAAVVLQAQPIGLDWL